MELPEDAKVATAPLSATWNPMIPLTSLFSGSMKSKSTMPNAANVTTLELFPNGRMERTHRMDWPAPSATPFIKGKESRRNPFSKWNCVQNATPTSGPRCSIRRITRFAKAKCHAPVATTYMAAWATPV